VAEVLQHFEALRFALAHSGGAWELVELVVAEVRHFEVLRFHSAVWDLLETSHSMHLSLEP